MDNEQVTGIEQHGMTHCHRHMKSISWAGVIAGALVATGLSFLFNLFDIGIGLSVINNTKEGVITVVLGGLVGMLIGTIVTMYVAGWVSGYLARPYCHNRYVGVLQGFTAWCLALIITLVLFASHVSSFTFGSQLLADQVATNTTVHVTTNENVPAISHVKNNPPQITVNAEKAANNIGIGTLITFLIFFLGALASCFGGYFGLNEKKSCCHCNEPTHTKMV